MTILKRVLCGLGLAAGLLASGLPAAPASAETLRVLAWDGYADPDWVKEFSAETGIDAKVVFIGSDDEIWAKIKGSEGKDFDVDQYQTLTPNAITLNPNQATPAGAYSSGLQTPTTRSYGINLNISF